MAKNSLNDIRKAFDIISKRLAAGKVQESNELAVHPVEKKVS